MKKAILSLLVVLSMSAAISTPSQAGSWSHTPTYNGGYNSTFIPSTGDILRSYGLPGLF